MIRAKIPTKIRETLIRWYNEGKSIAEIVLLFPELPRTSINSVIRKYKKTGSMIASPRGGTRHIKNTEGVRIVINGILSEDCTRTLKEIGVKVFELTGVSLSKSTVERAIQGLHFSLKRLVLSPVARNTPRNIEARYNYAVEFARLQNDFSDEQFYFLDEVGFALSTRRTRGRSFIGSSAVKEVTCIRSRNLSICVGMSIGGEYFKLVSSTPFNTFLFCDFLRNFIRNLHEKGISRGIFVLYNVRFHHCREVAEVVSLSGFSLLFLPPYSPFLNPIENSFSKWKANVIGMNATNETELIEFILHASGLFVVGDFQGYWRNMTRFLAKSLLREVIYS